MAGLVDLLTLTSWTVTLSVRSAGRRVPEVHGGLQTLPGHRAEELRRVPGGPCVPNMVTFELRGSACMQNF